MSAKMGALEFKEAMPKLFKNKNYVLLLISFGFFFGAIQGNAPNTAAMAVRDKFETAQVSVIFGIVVAMSVLGSVVLGKIVSNNKKFKCMTITGYAITLISWSGLIFAFNPKTYWLCLIILSVYGFFTMSMQAIIWEFAAELTYPVGVGVSGGIINLV